MLKYKIKRLDSDFIIPLDLSFDVADKDEAVSESFIQEQVIKSLPPQEDYEITRYFPLGVDEIQIALYKEEGVPMTYADMGFSDADLFFFYNRLRYSFLNVFYYDFPDKLQQSLKFQSDLFVQRVNLVDSNALYKTADDCEIVFKIKNPKTALNETEGFFIYLPNNQYKSPFSLYVTFNFNNALDGISYKFYPHKNLTNANVTNLDEYVKVNFVDKNFVFDTTDNTLVYDTNILKIDLYALIV